MTARARDDLGFGRREDGVADFDLAGMDQRLAVKAERQALAALGFEARQVRNVIIDAVKNR